MTAEHQPARPSADEVRALALDVAALYDLGGPSVLPKSRTSWSGGDAHGFILNVLDHTDQSSPEKFADALRQAFIHTGPGLRALLRLVGSSAAALTLSWILEEPPVIWDTGVPATRGEVLDAACAIAFWDRSTRPVPRWDHFPRWEHS